MSTGVLPDRLLLELCEPDRILAFSATSTRPSPWSFRYAGKPAVDGLGPVESMIALKPDLILMNNFGAIDRVAKLRAAGIEVFDLGQLRGMSTLLPTIEILAELVGHPERGMHLAAAFERRMKNVAGRLDPGLERRRAMYIASIGPRLYGGTTGTSYHDVLVHAGLTDVAASRYVDWPQYTAEQVLSLAPDLVLTKAGMASIVCAYPGMDRLPACKTASGIVELPAALLDDPGPAMLEATEELFARVYGPGN
jgi:iron complex transport system substrate-binding protein